MNKSAAISQEIASDWTETSLGELSEYVTSGSRDWKKYYAGQGALFVRTQDIKTNSLVLDNVPKVSLPKKVEGKRTLIHVGDLLVTITGNVGRVAVVEHDIGEAYVSQSVALVRLKDPSLAKFIQLQLLTKQSGKTHLESVSYGLGRQVLNLKNIKDTPIRLTPDELRPRIIAEIEKQFSRLDEAVASLKRVKANLKRYKAAVLKAAVEGKLTEEWRKQNHDVEPASKLLERILAERRTKWEEAELAKMKAKGKVPTNDKWKEKYKEPERSSDCLASLPSTWVSASIDQLADAVQYGSSSKTSEDAEGVPVLRMGNIYEGQLALNKLKYLPTDHPEFPELLLQERDFLFNRTNSPELVGKTAVYKGSPSPCSFASYLIRVKFLPGTSPVFVSSYVESLYGRLWVKSVVNQQVGQANVNGTKLKALVVPVPPEQEQREIEVVLEHLFSSINRSIEDNVRMTIRAERLRQSILSKAFTGVQ